MEWVADEGWSAKDLCRPGITSALDELEAGRAGVLAVAKLDRLSRLVHDFIGIVERARRQGWELVCLDPPFDLATPAGELMATMLAAFAQFERRLIGRRIREALAVKRTQGVRLGRRSALDPEVVERVVELRAEGLPWRAVAEAMTDEQWAMVAPAQQPVSPHYPEGPGSPEQTRPTPATALQLTPCGHPVPLTP